MRKPEKRDRSRTQTHRPEGTQAEPPGPSQRGMSTRDYVPKNDREATTPDAELDRGDHAPAPVPSVSSRRVRPIDAARPAAPRRRAARRI
jgi:hypothetical protein